ncbi:Stp1/IreP family PP2C-type Ser/Thr phosphatase [Ottowia sp. VDI28]|uniref:Stp1/IreP family PP2C-type Ser/Thr phosphatase n=1 Tax=Ottowia sp. VDI28 TaxID=3133968 RepID=UPI003C2CD2DD
MQLEYSSLSDAGRYRSNNEDAVLTDPAHGIVVLADGMGGYNAGEVASAMAVEQIMRELAPILEQAGSSAPVRELRRAIEVCVGNANYAIYEAARTQAAYAGMGTTLVMAVLHGQTLLVGHAGDSRAYRWRKGVLRQLTRDHSLLQEQLDAGLITPDQAAVSPHRNLVTRALGVEDTVLLDVQAFAVIPGDTYLLCSDGLTDMMDDHEIADVLMATSQIESRTAELIQSANANGGMDNITVALIQIAEVPKKSGIVAKLRG